VAEPIPTSIPAGEGTPDLVGAPMTMAAGLGFGVIVLLARAVHRRWSVHAS